MIILFASEINYIIHSRNTVCVAHQIFFLTGELP
jgi:hypothetical protein